MFRGTHPLVDRARTIDEWVGTVDAWVRTVDVVVGTAAGAALTRR
ncbi:hypothetical protein [Gordonia rhizosphera]|nr:hypothetical protein [Gordonia rhizosphera]